MENIKPNEVRLSNKTVSGIIKEVVEKNLVPKLTAVVISEGIETQHLLCTRNNSEVKMNYSMAYYLFYKIKYERAENGLTNEDRSNLSIISLS